MCALRAHISKILLYIHNLYEEVDGYRALIKSLLYPLLSSFNIRFNQEIFFFHIYEKFLSKKRKKKRKKKKENEKLVVLVGFTSLANFNL